ncbi:MAG: hypothetical protein JXK95_13785 [Bacteroidales bacterium]|nr:hypothetical protein [Bacteroidales bacterium]
MIRRKMYKTRLFNRLRISVAILLFSFIITGYSAAQTTWYSYQTGNWTDWRTWTTDPSGTTLINPTTTTPSSASNNTVVILNGRMVTIQPSVPAITTVSFTIQEGAILDLTTNTNVHNFGTFSGSGFLRLSTATFPSFASGSFVDAGGGTVEYTNMAGFTPTQFTYNNLIINLNNSTDEFYYDNATTLIINGDLTINRGMLRIGRNNFGGAARTVRIYGNTLVNANGQIQVGTRNYRHQIYMTGDLTNYGTVGFTSMSAPDYDSDPTEGCSDVYFNNNNADQNILCYGTTVFYRIVISKGSDQTFVLNIDADAPNRFYLYGRNNTQSSPPSPGPPNIPNNNALGLLSGTVRLGTNISLPCLSYNAVYNIDEDAQLWIDDGSVTFTTTTNYSSIVVYGKLRTTGNAVLNANGSQGIILREFSNFIIESGAVTTPCLRTSAIAGVHRGAFYMLGGSLTITGNNANVNGLQALKAYASMTIPYPENVFFMSGGTINITGSTTY